MTSSSEWGTWCSRPDSSGPRSGTTLGRSLDFYEKDPSPSGGGFFFISLLFILCDNDGFPRWGSGIIAMADKPNSIERG